jgi:hypothetical protein
VFGLLKVTRAVLPHMRRRRSGHVINFALAGGLSGSAGWGIYCSSKFAASEEAEGRDGQGAFSEAPPEAKRLLTGSSPPICREMVRYGTHRVD